MLYLFAIALASTITYKFEEAPMDDATKIIEAKCIVEGLEKTDANNAGKFKCTFYEIKDNKPQANSNLEKITANAIKKSDTSAEIVYKIKEDNIKDVTAFFSVVEIERAKKWIIIDVPFDGKNKVKASSGKSDIFDSLDKAKDSKVNANKSLWQKFRGLKLYYQFGIAGIVLVVAICLIICLISVLRKSN